MYLLTWRETISGLDLVELSNSNISMSLKTLTVELNNNHSNCYYLNIIKIIEFIEFVIFWKIILYAIYGTSVLKIIRVRIRWEVSLLETEKNKKKVYEKLKFLNFHNFFFFMRETLRKTFFTTCFLVEQISKFYCQFP